MTDHMEKQYKEVIHHLKNAYEAMKDFMALSEDWTEKVIVRNGFVHLRDVVRDFARYQYGRGVRKGQKKG